MGQENTLSMNEQLAVFGLKTEGTLQGIRLLGIHCT